MSSIVTAVKAVLNATALVSPRLAGGWAFYLFCHPAGRAKVRPNEKEVHAQAQVSQLTVNGKSVVVYRWGSGEKPVLMLHGWESRGSRFAAFVPKLLAQGFSPITFDSPGHGDSGGNATTILEYKALIHELQKQAGPFEAIIAHSFGVLCAFHAVRTGVSAKRMVTISGMSEFGYLVDEFSRRLSLGTRVQKDLRERVERLFVPEQNIWERFSVPYQPSLVQAPLLVIHDENDDVVGVAQARRLAEAFSQQTEFVATSSLGHRRILMEPSVIERVVQFIASPSIPQASTARQA